MIKRTVKYQDTTTGIDIVVELPTGDFTIAHQGAGTVRSALGDEAGMLLSGKDTDLKSLKQLIDMALQRI